jgi:hypothetical protein
MSFDSKNFTLLVVRVVGLFKKICVPAGSGLSTQWINSGITGALGSSSSGLTTLISSLGFLHLPQENLDLPEPCLAEGHSFSAKGFLV